MAITYKLFLDERTQKSNKKFALKLRVTYDRKHRVIPLNVELLKKDWNAESQKVKASHVNAKLITVKINQMVNEIQEKALKFETREKVYGVDDLASNGKTNNSSTTFLSFANDQIASLMKAGRVGNAITYKTATNRLIAFTGKTDLKFEQIDFKLLDSFTNSLLGENLTINAIGG